MHRRARAGMLAATLVVAAGIPVLGADPADAATYRYWTYWHGDTGAWSFSGVGASSWRVKDGSVEGWRFAVSTGTRSAPTPRYDAAAAFDRLCGGMAKPDGAARVALVVDFGTADDARPGDDPREPSLRGVCVVVSPSSSGSPPTGLAVLNESGTSVREDGGMVCGLGGYPSAGCGEVVRTPSSTPAPSSSRTPSAKPTPSRTPGSTSGPSTTAGAGSTPRPSGSDGGAAAGAPTSAVTASTTPPSASATASAASSSAPDASGAAAPSVSPELVVGLASTTDPDTGGGTPWPLVAGLAVVAALGGSAWWSSRRRGPS